MNWRNMITNALFSVVRSSGKQYFVEILLEFRKWPGWFEYNCVSILWRVFTAAMMEGWNNETVLHENRSYFPEKRKCIVFVLQHGGNDVTWLYFRKTQLQTLVNATFYDSKITARPWKCINFDKASVEVAWALSRFSARAQVPWPTPEKSLSGGTVGTSRKASGSSGYGRGKSTRNCCLWLNCSSHPPPPPTQKPRETLWSWLLGILRG